MLKRKNKPFLFQNLKGKKIKFSITELTIINGLKPLTGGEWEGKIKETCSVSRKNRDDVRIKIKDKLIKIQGRYCIYCGLHEDYCGQLEREHIAPKGRKRHPCFMFEPENLCLACHQCNFDLKKEEDTISKKSNIYNKCKFSIVHPYFDDYEKHIQFAVEDARVLIKSMPWSRKGKRTISLFELDSVAKTSIRGGLLTISNWKFKSKYDPWLNGVLENKHMRY